MTRVRTIGVVVLATAVGFGAGAASGIRTRTVTETGTAPTPSVPQACRSALSLASDGFDAVHHALSLARAANQTTVSGAAPGQGSLPAAGSATAKNPAPPASEAILSEAVSRVAFLQRRYFETRNACEADASTAPRANAPAGTTSGR